MDADASDAAPGTMSEESDPWRAVGRRPDPQILNTTQATFRPAADQSVPGAAPEERPPPASRRPWRWAVEWGIVLVVALAVALGVRAFVIQTFFIPSASMEPTLMIGDRILVDKLSYHLHAVRRGDMIVFARPPGEAASENVKDLVKRVVGLPNETIWSSHGDVFVRGPDTHERALEIPEPVPGTQLGPSISPTKIPPGDYYVLGDNRTDSDDSRFFGPISGRLIVGRVVMRIWPLDRITFF